MVEASGLRHAHTRPDAVSYQLFELRSATHTFHMSMGTCRPCKTRKRPTKKEDDTLPSLPNPPKHACKASPRRDHWHKGAEWAMAHSATGRRITAAMLQLSSIDRTIARANPWAPEDQTGGDPHVLREMRTMSRCGHHLHKHTAISRSTQIRCSTRKRRRGRQGLNRLRTLLGAV